MDIKSTNNNFPASNSLTSKNKQLEAKEIEKEIERATEAGKNFEAYYLGFMLEQVFSKLPTDGLVSGGHAEKIYRSMLVQEYAKQITNNASSNTSLGLAESVTKELLRSQFSNSNSKLIDNAINGQSNYHNPLTNIEPSLNQSW